MKFIREWYFFHGKSSPNLNLKHWLYWQKLCIRLFKIENLLLSIFSKLIEILRQFAFLRCQTLVDVIFENESTYLEIENNCIHECHENHMEQTNSLWGTYFDVQINRLPNRFPCYEYYYLRHKNILNWFLLTGNKDENLSLRSRLISA
jgi:hypothetical protein